MERDSNMHDKLVHHIKQHLDRSNSSSESSESSSLPMVDISDLKTAKKGLKGDTSSPKNEALTDALKDLIFSNNNANMSSSPAKASRRQAVSPHKSKKLSSSDLQPEKETQKPVSKKKGRGRQQKKNAQINQKEVPIPSVEPLTDGETTTTVSPVKPDVTTDTTAVVSRRRTRWRLNSQPSEQPTTAVKRKHEGDEVQQLSTVTERVRKRPRNNETIVPEIDILQSDDDEDDEIILNIPTTSSSSVTDNQLPTSTDDVETTDLVKPSVSQEEEEARSSPGVHDMVASMQTGMDKAKMKASLEQMLEKRVQDKQGITVMPPYEPSQPSHATMSTLIPRLTALSAHKTGDKKNNTPGKNRNWTAIHERQFRKMDSLDVYIRKRHARTTSMMSSSSSSSSVRKVQQMTEQMRYALTSLKSHKTPQPAKIIKAIKGGGNKQPTTTPFVPRVTNTAQMDLNFRGATTPAGGTQRPKTTAATKENEGSPRRLTTLVNTGPRKSDVGCGDSVRKALLPASARKSIGGTRLHQPPESEAKKFDLKSSLAKPITWKRHTGKLQPFEIGQLYNHETDVKKVKVQSRDDRRVAAEKHRANQRLQAQMKRRGQLA